MIRDARAADLSEICGIEAAAGELFRLIGMAAIADDPPPALEALAVYQQDGRAWVATDSADHPIAYLLLDVVERFAHVEQVTVHPRYARRGIGRVLIEEAARWAVERGRDEMTLTTFEDVPWNAPYYRRLGFREVTEAKWSDGIRRIMQSERDHGLAAWPRVVMKKSVTAGGSLPDPGLQPRA